MVQIVTKMISNQTILKGMKLACNYVKLVINSYEVVILYCMEILRIFYAF